MSTESTEDPSSFISALCVIKEEKADYIEWNEDPSDEFTSNAYDQPGESFTCENCSMVFEHGQTYKDHIQLASCYDGNLAFPACTETSDSTSMQSEMQQTVSIKVEPGVSNYHPDIEETTKSNKRPFHDESVVKSEPAYEDSTLLPPAIKQERIDEIKTENPSDYLENDESDCECEPGQAPMLDEVHETMVCNMCGGSFESNYKLVLHIYDDHGLPVECEKCATVCRTMRVLLEHVTMIHPVRAKLICGECKQEFSERMELMKHMKKKHRHYMCNICAEVFIGDKELIKHDWLEHRKRNKYLCKPCNKAFNSETLHLLHVEKKHKTKWCDKCGKAFHTVLALWTHRNRVHKIDMAYQCGECGAAFRLSSGLVVHIMCVHSAKYIVCNVCGLRFAKKKLLLKHKKTVHIDTCAEFQCNVCSVKFDVQRKLGAHMRKEHKEYTFRCKKCGKGYKENSYLTSHMRAHQAKNTYVCTKCDASFKFKIQLTRHENIHKAVRCTKVCSHCRMGFIKSIGKYKYCDLCEKKAVSKKRKPKNAASSSDASELCKDSEACKIEPVEPAEVNTSESLRSCS